MYFLSLGLMRIWWNPEYRSRVEKEFGIFQVLNNLVCVLVCIVVKFPKIYDNPPFSFARCVCLFRNNPYEGVVREMR